MELKSCFKIEIMETLSRVIEVEAEHIDDAIKIAKSSYSREEIVLDHNDFVDVEITPFDEYI
jgi:hypothetical protein